MNNSLKVLITGTSNGLGHDLTKIFLKKHPTSTIYATSRDDLNKSFKRWKSVDINKCIKCHQL